MSNVHADAVRTRTLEITPDLVREYSRRGNYHSEASDAAALGLPGLLVQGVQVAGPAYALLLDEWGEEFLATGTLDVRFVDAVYAPATVAATITLEGDGTATVDVTAEGAQRPAVVGRAQRRSTER